MKKSPIGAGPALLIAVSSACLAAACSEPPSDTLPGSGGGATGASSGTGANASENESGGRSAGNGGEVFENSGGRGSSGSGGRESPSSGGTDLGGMGPGGAPPAEPSSCAAPSWDEADFSEVYDVGPGLEFETPSEVPWEFIGPGTLVRIHRRATPYADKWVIAVAATANAPLVVLGVPADGKLPEITGDGATTRAELDYWSDTRGIIKIGGSSRPALEMAEHVFVECLDISGARETNSYFDELGEERTYDGNAAAIFLESGAHITLRNNIFRDSGNGLFIASQSSDVLVSGNELFDNGNPNSVYEHNSYTEAQGITFEFNRYGELCAGCTGNNLKDRSSGLVIRYNHILGGNRALDLVDSYEPTINGAPDYDDTFVYGNVLIETDGGNRQVVHYGGDGVEEDFRRGTLYFYHNTVVSERPSLATLVRLSSPEATLDARNNILFASPGSNFAILEDAGTAMLTGNWLPSGWLEGSPSLTGVVTATDNREGDDPGFVDGSARNFVLEDGSSGRGGTVALAPAATPHPVLFQPDGADGRDRPTTENAGAFE